TDIAATCGALSHALPAATSAAGDWLASWQAVNRRARRAVDSLISSTAAVSGSGLFARLARALPQPSLLYTGNSLPLRQLEAVWPADAGQVRMLCNRGANGIDGV